MATYFGQLRSFGKRKREKEEEEEESDSGEDDDSLPTVSGRRISYPQELATPKAKIKRKRGDPYAHLGPIGYTRNTWRSRGGPLQQAQNLFLGFHVKKSARLELARRLILAESLGGLPRNCDADSLVSKQDYFYKSGEAPDRTHNLEIHEANKPSFDVSEYFPSQ